LIAEDAIDILARSREAAMEYRPLGNAGRDVSLVGQGTWYMDRGHRASAIAALRRGIDLGMTHIDTAEYYGEAENIVGEAIAGRRGDVFLVSKVMPQNASRAGTIAACERSLQRLRTDRLDCYLLHWRGAYPLAETFAAFAALKAGGKILSCGVSNFDVADLEDAVGVASKGEIACNQVLYHLQERAMEHAVLPWCAVHNVALVGYSPFGHDDFPHAASKGGRALAEVAAAHGASARQVALAFLVRNSPLFTIPKTSNPAHAAENAAAGELRLSETEVARIDAAFPRGHARALPML
jgi:diketogulonate reductase-like aldo/keto reductase